MSVAVSDPTYKPGRAASSWRAPRPAVHQRPEGRAVPRPDGDPHRRRWSRRGSLLFVPGGFRWWLAAVHFALFVHFLGPFVLMLHNTSHRSLFRKSWGWMNQYIPWVLGPFFGESPETYFAHHVGMHHPENNLEDDISSTLPYRRDSVRGLPALLPALLLRGPRRAHRLPGSQGPAIARWSAPSWASSLFSGRRRRAAASSNWRATLTVFAVPVRRGSLRDDGRQLGPARVHRRGLAREQLPQQHHVHQQHLQPALLQRRLSHRPPPEGDAALDGAAGGVSPQRRDLRRGGRHRLHGDRLLRRLALPDAQALQLAGAARSCTSARSIAPRKRRSLFSAAGPGGCETPVLPDPEGGAFALGTGLGFSVRPAGSGAPRGARRES